MELISLLPSEIAKGDVVKVELNPGRGETDRAILIVTPGGSVLEHSHAGDKSELYIELVIPDGIGDEMGRIQPAGEKTHMERVEMAMKLTDVAGLNSPTRKLTHGIGESSKPQIILAIKKSQDPGAWEDLNKLQQLGNLNVNAIYSGPNIQICSNGQILKFELDCKSFTLYGGENGANEFKTLSGLQRGRTSPQQPEIIM